MSTAERERRRDAEAHEFWRAHLTDDLYQAAARSARLASQGRELEAVGEARLARHVSEALLGQAVAEARGAGRGWDEIGRMLDLDPEDARRRYENPAPGTFYAEAGGAEAFRGLVERFYAGVASDPLLRPMYPEDLSGAKERLETFLAQYWGGPRDYSQRRGHPRLRMRHSGFPMTLEARAAWLHHMREALEGSEMSEPLRGILWNYLERSADTL